MMNLRALYLFGAVAALFPAACAAQDRPVELAAEVTVDLVGQMAGAGDRKLRALTNVDLTADLDLAALAGWDGATMHVYVLDNRGARPNDVIGTLQGVDNIEVPDAGLRLFEAWVEQGLGGGASLRAGLYDVNSEFYANDAAGMLIAPPFGIGSEIAATGPNGPSIFPSSALAARIHVPVGTDGAFVRAAVINARASTIGDAGGVDFSFRDGVLLMGEVGRSGARLRGAVGVWAYSRDPEDLFETTPDGMPLRKPSRGIYGVLEGDLVASESGTVTAFFRAGLSDRHATPFGGGFQAGALMAPVVASRPESRVSLGLHHAWTNRHFRDQQRLAGVTAGNETVVELTVSDTLAPSLTVQPDVQWIHNPGGIQGASDAVVAIMRVIFSF